ncbi:hypothetical protein MMA231_01903 [Asticcacaulis sp. MM231]
MLNLEAADAVEIDQLHPAGIVKHLYALGRLRRGRWIAADSHLDRLNLADSRCSERYQRPFYDPRRQEEGQIPHMRPHMGA